MSRDRRLIVPLLREHIPELEGLSSDDVHAALDALTGLSTDPMTDNASAFDAWRRALAALDYPVWPYTRAQEETMRARAFELKQQVEARLAGQPVMPAARRTDGGTGL